MLEVRGEMYFPVKAFEELNDELTEPGSGRSRTRATPRPGSLRQKDPKVTASRPLRLWVHSFGAAEGVAFDSHLGFLDVGGDGRAPGAAHHRGVRLDRRGRGVPRDTGRSTGTRSTARSTAR